MDQPGAAAGVPGDLGLDRLRGAVLGGAVDEHHFGRAAHLRDTVEQPRDVAALVAARDDHRAREVVAPLGAWPCDEALEEAEAAEQRQLAEHPVAERREEGHVLRREQPPIAPDHLEAGEREQVLDVVGREPVLVGLRHLGAEALGGRDERLPEGVVVVDVEAGAARAQAAERPQERLHVGEVADHSGDDDGVEALVERDLFVVQRAELEARSRARGCRRHGWRELAAYPATRRHRLEDVSGPVADLQHRLPGRDVEREVARALPVVVGVARLPSLPLGGEAVVERDQVAAAARGWDLRSAVGRGGERHRRCGIMQHCTLAQGTRA